MYSSGLFWCKDTDQKIRVFYCKWSEDQECLSLILFLNPTNTLIHMCIHMCSLQTVCTCKGFVSLNHYFLSFSEHAARKKSNICLVLIYFFSVVSIILRSRILTICHEFSLLLFQLWESLWKILIWTLITLNSCHWTLLCRLRMPDTEMNSVATRS